jgi:hypothetical protein
MMPTKGGHMFKKIIVLILALSLIFTLSSCGLDYRHSLDENKHNKIEVIMENEDKHSLIYQDTGYDLVGSTNFFSVMTYKTEDGYYLSYEDDILLSWNGNRYIWYIDEYYSYTADEPLFIYNSRLKWVYFREDYDYTSDTFVIDGTESEIIWNNIFISSQTDVDFIPQCKVSIYSKQCPRIDTSLEMALVGDQWYIRFSDSQEEWIPTDEFIRILSINGII